MTARKTNKQYTYIHMYMYIYTYTYIYRHIYTYTYIYIYIQGAAGGGPTAVGAFGLPGWSCRFPSIRLECGYQRR